ncbi:MAG: spore cortex biosynthesis protein YabQ [Candidatus Desulforudis sp.]|nr:spore cortex biosynthesis protein YabQ [Desulforudis sp.]
MSLEAQFLAFLISIGIGIGAGFLFDSYRTIRITLRFGRVGTSIGDLMAWIVLTFIVFFLLLLVNWGEVRWYILLGLGLGALVYRRIFSRPGGIFWRRSFDIAGQVMRVLVSPMIFAWRMLRRLCRILAWPFVRLPFGLRRNTPEPPQEAD